MSAINGDRSRFHRVRKQKIARRKRNHEMFKSLADRKPASVPTTAPAKAKIA